MGVAEHRELSAKSTAGGPPLTGAGFWAPTVIMTAAAHGFDPPLTLPAPHYQLISNIQNCSRRILSPVYWDFASICTFTVAPTIGANR